MLHDRLLISVSLVIAVAYTGAGMVSPILVLYAQAHGASLASISLMASAFLITNFAAQYPAGWLADRTGRVPLLAASLLLQAGTSCAYLFTTDATALVVLRGIEGIGAAATLPSARALIADGLPAQRQGAAFGVFGSAFNAGFLLGPPLGGLLASAGYSHVFLAAMVCRFIGVGVVLIFLREPPIISHKQTVRSPRSRLPACSPCHCLAPISWHLATTSGLGLICHFIHSGCAIKSTPRWPALAWARQPGPYPMSSYHPWVARSPTVSGAPG